jgi:single-stranded DNA-specific DHH superfamily exonuclease
MDIDKIAELLGSSGKKLLLYHTDVDGVCSAVLMTRFFKGFSLIPREGPVMDDKFLRELTGSKADVLAVLDIPIDQEWKKLEALRRESPGTRMVIVDHHVPEKDLNSDSDFHINPRFSSKLYIPASVLVYRLMRDMGQDVKPLIWIAALGVIGDYAFQDCKDVLDECMKAMPEIGPDPKKSILARISEMVISSVVLHGAKGAARSVEIMSSAGGPGDVAKDAYLLGCDRKVSGEIKRCLAEFREKAKEYPDLGLFVYRLRSRMNIASTISTILAEKHPDKILIVTKHGDQHVKISARYQDGKINLSDLMKRSVAGIGSGGGHVKAAGAIVGKKHLPEFERRLLGNLRTLME